MKAPSDTGALRSVHDSAEVQRGIAPYQRALLEVPREHPKANGVVVVVDGEILAADLFGSNALFGQLWPQLLEAYAIDALEHDTETSHEVRAKHGLGREEVRHWLGGMADADRTRKDTPGDGAIYELRGRRLTGSALVWERGVVHMALFPGEREAESDFNSLQFRREQLQH